jgi:hypothetical protein
LYAPLEIDMTAFFYVCVIIFIDTGQGLIEDIGKWNLTQPINCGIGYISAQQPNIPKGSHHHKL